MPFEEPASASDSSVRGGTRSEAARPRVTFRLLSSVSGGELRRFGREQTSPTLDGLKRAIVARRGLSGPTSAPHAGLGNLSLYAVPPDPSGRVTLPEGLDACGQTGLRGRRAARRPGSQGTSQRDEASKWIEGQTWSRTSVRGFGWEVAYLAGRGGTDRNGAFDGVTLRPSLYPPDSRERARWQERPITGDGERWDHEPIRLERRRRGRYRRSRSSRTIRDACGSTRPTPPRTARIPPVNSWRPPQPTRGTGTE
jgi:hypothetical protein